MNRTGRIIVGAMLCLSLAGPGAIGAETPYTVGEFAVGLARTITGRADYTPEAAAAVLRGMGAELTADLDAEVSEKLFADAFNQFGLDLVTSNPDRAMTRKDAAKLLGAFSAVESHAGNSSSIKCKDGPNKGLHCFTNADCPDSFCRIPPGQAKKIASPGEP